MKRKTVIFWLAAVFMLATIMVGADENRGASEMELNGGTRGKVPFPHLRHQQALGDCQICHDVFPQAAGAIDAYKTDGKLSAKQVMNKQCIKCHRERKKNDQASGPTVCSQCHVRS